MVISMIFKNSIKILFSNFSIVWKMVLYFLLALALSAGLLFLFVNPILKSIESAGFFEEFVELYSDFLTNLNLSGFFEELSVLIDNLFRFMFDNAKELWFWFAGIIFVVFFLNSFLLSLSNMAVCKSLHLYIGSMNKQGFFTSFADGFGKNLRFQFVKYLVSLPINVLYGFLFIVSLRLFGISWYINILAIMLIIVGFVLLFAFKTMIFSVWCPAYVVLNFGIFKSLRTAIKTVFKRFTRFFGAALGVVLTIFVLNVFLGLFTFIVGFIVSVPISYMLYNVLGMVSIYEGQGMRYYVDVYNVITPNKKETADKLKDMKYVV